MAKFIVERIFETPVSDADLGAVAAGIKGCLGLYDVIWSRSYCSTDRLRMICEFEAKDAETVRKVQHEAHAPFERVWSADLMVQTVGG